MKLGRSKCGYPMEQTMGWQNDQSWIVHANEHGQDKVCWMLFREW